MSINNPKGHSVSDADLANFVKLPGVFTIATLPTELQAGQRGLLAYVSDGNGGAGGFYSLGASGVWNSVGGGGSLTAGIGILISGSTISIDPTKVTQLPAKWGIPVILPSSGSIGNNGALTLTTALDSIYTQCWMYFPVGAISSGSAAGVYYVQMSSTTVGTIFNNVLAAGSIPTTIASPTALATTGPGAYTQTTGSLLTLVSTPVAANALGANGSITQTLRVNIPNNANVKTVEMLWNGVNGGAVSVASILYYGMQREYQNLGVTNKQRSYPTGGGSGSDLTTSTSAPTAYTADTTAATTIGFGFNMATATDYMVCFSGTVELRYAA